MLRRRCIDRPGRARGAGGSRISTPRSGARSGNSRGSGNVKRYAPASAARAAVAPNPERPATAVLHDADDLRLVVFRIGPGQEVPLHRSGSSVMLTVLEGSGILTGEENGERVDYECRPGDVVTYGPNEVHGMRGGVNELLLLAATTPRPGNR